MLIGKESLNLFVLFIGMGEAYSPSIGSINIFKLPICIKNVECPNHIILIESCLKSMRSFESTCKTSIDLLGLLFGIEEVIVFNVLKNPSDCITGTGIKNLPFL